MTQKLNRRQFAKVAAAVPWMARLPDCSKLDYEGGLTDIPGIEVGHYTLDQRPTGVTVVLTGSGAVAGVDVRGSAPGTRETDLLNPINTVRKVHAILLAGGSAFGLDAASGVVRYLEEQGIGFPTTFGSIPIVPAAILYDLGLGDPKIRPDRDAGYRACQRASTSRVEEGCLGAGAGATVGKMFGIGRAMKSGVGSAGMRADRLRIAALSIVNSLGDVLDPSTGKLLAGARNPEGTGLVNTTRTLKSHPLPKPPRAGENTTLVVIATNAVMDKTEMTKVAQMGQDGLARAINPVHTPYDGDTVFAVSTGEFEGADLGTLGALAAEVVARAVVRAVLKAKGNADLPACCDLSW